MANPRPLAALTACAFLHFSGAKERPPFAIEVADGGDPGGVSLLQQRMLQSRGHQERALLSKRDPLWRVSLQGYSDGDAAHDVHLVVNHLAKCGGSFVKDVLFQSVPGMRLEVENEADSVTRYDLEGKSFIIGLIRNPFEYYVSLWAYTSNPKSCCFEKALSRAQRREMLGRARPLGSTADDRERFKRWLFAVNSRELGVKSLRFYGSYLYNWGSRHRLVSGRWHYLRASDPEVEGAAAPLNAVLAELGTGGPMRGPIDCWVHTESLSQDLETCLRDFERVTGKHVVDWFAFNQSLDMNDHNGADHVPCSMFYDNESLALVRSADRHLIRAFGYPDHCEG
mmetsp:Transcript_67546/g.208960  ORF Transcript_67546/g.208960 Transcript_67546/m.208960 type:complete len:340 (-) Transcript_67546:51-1070(-)